MTLASFTAPSKISSFEFIAERSTKPIRVKRLRTQDEFSISIDFRLSLSLREIKAFAVTTATTLLAALSFFRKTIKSFCSCSSTTCNVSGRTRL